MHFCFFLETKATERVAVGLAKARAAPWIVPLVATSTSRLLLKPCRKHPSSVMAGGRAWKGGGTLRDLTVSLKAPGTNGIIRAELICGDRH